MLATYLRNAPYFGENKVFWHNIQQCVFWRSGLLTNKLETFAHFCVTIGTQGRRDRFFADKTPTFAATLAATSLAGRCVFYSAKSRQDQGLDSLASCGGPGTCNTYSQKCIWAKSTVESWMLGTECWAR